MTRSLLLLILAACGGHDEAHAPTRDLAERVAWATPETTAEVPVTTLPAEVVPAPGAAWRLAPPTPGRLTAWAVEPGQRVEAGQTLATLTSPALADLEGALAAARATVARREAAAEAARAAAARGVVSTTARRDAEAALNEAEAEVRALSSRLSATRDTTSRAGGSWAWTAPEAGLVQALTCDLGPVGPDAACVHLVDPDRAQVRVRLPERYLDAVGDVIGGTFTGADGRQAALTLHSTAPALDPHTRTRELRFLADPSPPLGASGRALLRIPASEGVVAVPRAALTRVEGRPAVLVRDGERGRPTVVDLVGQDPARVWLRDLPADAEVAVEGVFLLKSLALLDEDAAGGHDQ